MSNLEVVASGFNTPSQEDLKKMKGICTVGGLDIYLGEGQRFETTETGKSIMILEKGGMPVKTLQLRHINGWIMEKE